MWSIAWGLLACGPKRLPDATVVHGACELQGLPAVSESTLPELLRVARSLHPELDHTPIELVPSRSGTVFFRADPRPGTLLRRRSRRVYRVHASEALYADPPPADAVVAILDHELEHIRHYTTMSTPRLLAFGFDYAIGGTATYERYTDQHALRSGCGEGLARYREWLYERIPPRAEARKRRTYVTPDEARSWVP